MMFFEVEHIFEASVEAVEAAMFHPDYLAFLRSQSEVLDGLSAQSVEDSGSHIARRVHYRPRPAFDHIGPKKVPPDWFEFVEQSTWDKSARRLVFDNVPCTDKVARRFVSRGEIVLEPLSPRRTRRRTRAEVRLHSLPLMLRPLAGLAEQMLAREAKKLLESEARVLHHFIASGLSERPPAA